MAPPEFLQLAGHPLRWALLGHLAKSDHTVQELMARVEEPQNLVSYHLAQLRRGGLVSSRRSSADGRDAYYTVDLARLGEELVGTGAALHPGLRLTLEPDLAKAKGSVLFLCTGNSARSQMAEALVNARAGGRTRAASAGSHPKPLHPNAVRAMREDHGLDLSGHRPKHVDTLRRRRFDLVVTLCDRVKEVCPELPGGPETRHWSLPDPAAAGSTDAASYPTFRQTAAQLDARIGFLLAELAAPVRTNATGGKS